MKLNKFNKNLKEEFNNIEKEEIAIKKKSIIKPTFLSLSLASLVLVITIIAVILNTNGSNSNNKFNKYFNQYNNAYYKELNKTSKEELQDREDYGDFCYEFHHGFGYGSANKTDMEQYYADTVTNKEGESQYETNNQEFGVDEADIAKSDGSYVYYLTSTHYSYSIDYNIDFTEDKYLISKEVLYVYDLTGNIICTKEFENYSYYRFTFYSDRKMVIYDNKIIIMSSHSLEIYELKDNKLHSLYDTSIYNVNISILDMRLLDNTLYYVSRSKTNVLYLDYDNTYYDEISDFACEYMLNKIDLDTLGSDNVSISSVSLLSSPNAILYMNNTHIVISNNSYFLDYDDLDYTLNSVFTIDLVPVGTFVIHGEVDNKYFIDVYENQLRIVGSRSWYYDYENSLSIFDLNTKELMSKIDKGLGHDMEAVKSVNFKDDKCYIVTFYQQDPLYEIDLSNPYELKITSALEMPGYSIYTKSFYINGNEYLFGMGYLDSDYKYSVYKINNDKENEVLKDYIFNEKDYTYFITDFENPLSLFIYNTNDYLYVGKSISTDKYLLMKIDVNSDEVFSVYKDIETNNLTRLFLINDKIYIPNGENIIIEEF